MNRRPRILFLCTGNSCRSQMAEGWTRHIKGDLLEPYSAGVDPKGIDPLAVEVMKEVDIDISGHSSKSVGDVASIEFDYVVTLCDNAREMCPIYPGDTKILHRGFDDPHTLVPDDADKEAELDIYRRIRDEIRDFVGDFPEALRPDSD